MKSLRSLWHREQGFTYLESMMSTAIMALVMGAVVVAIYQFHTLSRRQQDTLSANQQVQNVAALLNHDVVSAASGSVSADTLTLSIPEYAFGEIAEPVTHTVTYRYAGGSLTREEDGGGAMAIARHLTDVDLGQAGALSRTVQITITAQIRGETAPTVLTFHRRPTE